MKDLSKSEVTVVIVSYNVRSRLASCLESLPESARVVVVDNASEDGSAECVALHFPQVTLVQNSTNRGFGAACNQGIRLSETPLVLLLNPDCIARPGSIEKMVQVMDDPRWVALGGRLEFPGGALQESCCKPLSLWAVFLEQTGLEVVFRKLGYSSYWQSSKLVHSGAGPHNVAQVMGACLMFRPKEVFDEDFFLYVEDTDLCHRLKRHGEIGFLPEANFEHALGASSTDNRAWSVAMYNLGKELYFRKHFGASAGWICLILNRGGAIFRVLLGCLTLKFNRAKLFWGVLWMPMRGPKLPSDAKTSS